MVAGGKSPPRAIHFSSHAAVLKRSAVNGRRTPDAIVVSASRPVVNLLPALRLGAAIDVPVVVMCSRAARADSAASLAADNGARCVAVDVSLHHPWIRVPDFETAGFRQARIGSHGDLSRKRNMGLMLGRLAGWRTMLFLDDDISSLSPVKVSRATAALEHFVAVGMPAKQYSDNSVVCHARRLTGGRQGVFVSGSALAIDVGHMQSFFPDIYNEDWLFLAPHLDQRKVTCHGTVRQQPYEPFRYPHRAGAQEFGEVVAEGLIGYLHSRPLRPLPSHAYWAAFLHSRAAFVSSIKSGCAAGAMQHGDAARAITALESAERALTKVSAAVVSEYVQAWRHDLVVWRQFLTRLPHLGSLPAALRHLGLPNVTVSPRSSDTPTVRHAYVPCE